MKCWSRRTNTWIWRSTPSPKYLMSRNFKFTKHRKGKFEVNNKEKLTWNAPWDRHEERKGRLQVGTLMTSSESGMREIKKDLKYTSNTSISRTCKLSARIRVKIHFKTSDDWLKGYKRSRYTPCGMCWEMRVWKALGWLTLACYSVDTCVLGEEIAEDRTAHWWASLYLLPPQCFFFNIITSGRMRIGWGELY